MTSSTFSRMAQRSGRVCATGSRSEFGLGRPCNTRPISSSPSWRAKRCNQIRSAATMWFSVSNKDPKKAPRSSNNCVSVSFAAASNRREFIQRLYSAMLVQKEDVIRNLKLALHWSEGLNPTGELWQSLTTGVYPLRQNARKNHKHLTQLVNHVELNRPNRQLRSGA